MGARRRKISGEIRAAASHEVGSGRRALDDPARAQDEQPRRQDDVDQGGVASVEGAQPFPDPPRPLVLTIGRPLVAVPPRGFRGRSHSGYR